MKKLMMSIFICAVLISCKKEPGDPPIAKVIEAEKQKFKLTFNLDDFSAQVLGMKNATISEAPLNKVVEHLVYIAYDEEGIEVSRIRQNSTGLTQTYRPDDDGNSNEVNLGILTFGSLTDSLAAGDYTIVMVASQKEFGIGSYNEAAYQPFDPLSRAYFIYEYRFMGKDGSNSHPTLGFI